MNKKSALAMKKTPVKKNSVGKKVVIAPNNKPDQNDLQEKTVKKSPSVLVKKDLDATTIKMSDGEVIKNSELTLDDYLKQKELAGKQLAAIVGLIQPKASLHLSSKMSPKGSPKESPKNSPPESPQESPQASPKMSPKASPKISPKNDFKYNPQVSPPSTNSSNWGDEEIDPALPELVDSIDGPEGVTGYPGITGPPPPDDMDIDTEEDNCPDEAQFEQYNKEELENNRATHINGITYEELKSNMQYNKQIQMVQCSYCQKFYHKSQQPKMITMEFSEGEPVCFHCIFWMNYDVSTRPQVDGVYGMTIVEYVVECKDFHDKALCTRNSDAGGCLLCDYLNGMPIDNVFGAEVLIREIAEPEPVEDDKSYLQSVDYSFVITI